MSVLIRCRCHTCGANRQADAGSWWVVCTYCDNVLAFDWMAWFESPEYAAHLKAMQTRTAEWQRVGALNTEADAAAAKGDFKKVEAAFTKFFELLFSLQPHLYRPQLKTDEGYRKRQLAFQVSSMVAMRRDAQLAAWDKELKALAAKVDWSDPLPPLEKIADLLAKETQRLFELGVAEDPDGMRPDQRTRLTQMQFLSAFLPFVPKEKRLELLRKVYGKESVVEKGGASPSEVDEGGMFAEFTCPACGLCSPQMRASPMFICLGCSYRKSSKEDLPALDLQCRGCGAPISLAKNALTATCEICSTVVQRSARTFAAEKQLMEESSRNAGVAFPEIGDGMPGQEVTDENRMELLSAGLANVANGWYALLNEERFAKLVQKSLPKASDAERARVLKAVLAESPVLSAEGRRILDGAAKRLGGK